MIRELAGSFIKAKLEIGKPAVEVIPCTLNPSSYTIKKSANYSSKKSLGDNGENQFTGLDPSELSMTLYFDSSSMMNLGLNALNLAAAGGTPDAESILTPVSAYTNKLLKLVMVKASEHKPPLVTFCWGNLEFTGYVTSVNQSFTKFTINGIPIRAKVDLSIRRSDGEDNPPLESPDRTKYRTFTEGMSLWALAYEEYGDCEKWRVIARDNQLANPLDLKPGRLIRIPALRDLEEE